jgi:predicted aminopeptidase
LLCLLLAALTGCYSLQAARGQWALSRASKPIRDVVAAPGSSEKLRGQLQQAQAVRAFAIRELGLPDNASYTRYAELRRPFVVWNVVATPELSLTPRRWCFPVAGCVSYRGYFRERSATRFAARQRRRGRDAMVGGVPAYSTLGYFADPVPDSLLRFGDLAVAGTIIHELAHQRLYVAGDSDFNEAFATVVAQQGLQRWLTSRQRTADLQKQQREQAVGEEFDALFAAARRDLLAIYGSPEPADAQRKSKQARLARLGTDLLAVEQRLGVRMVYGDWARQGLSNAHLAAVATYSRCVPGLLRLFAEAGGDFERFYARAGQLATVGIAARHAAVC